MSNPKHNRVALAVEQLHVAIDLLLSDRSAVSALTLAGAAEEVLGRKANRFGAKQAIDRSHEITAMLTARSGRTAPSLKAYRAHKNEVRNLVKHLDSTEDEDFEADLVNEAIAKVGAACVNYANCGLPFTPKMSEFDGWYNARVHPPEPE